MAAIKAVTFVLLLTALALSGGGSVYGQSTSPSVVTPDDSLNRAIAEGRSALPYRLDPDRGEIVIEPWYLAEHPWLVVRDAELGSQTVSFFVNDGWLYTDGRFQNNTRRRRFSSDVSGRIHANADVLAYHREQVVENEIVLFIVSPSDQTVRLTVDPDLLGEERELTFEMKAGEGRFVHLVIPPDEYTVVTWAPEDVSRERVDLTGTWRFYRKDVTGASAADFDDGAWETISLPHSWNARDVYDTRNVHDGLDILEWYYRGPAWYRTEFTGPSAPREASFQLHFLGANQVADVYLNGEHLGRHIGGYTGFRFDVTQHLRRGERNSLAVRVTNEYDYDIPPHSADYNFYGGLYREVELIVTDPVHVRDTWLTTPDVSHRSATVSARTTIRNDGRASRHVRLVTNIINPYGEIAHSMVDERTIPSGGEVEVRQRSEPLMNPMLWAPEHPWLYRVASTVYDIDGRALDQTFEPLGLRWFDFDADLGFFLNGEPLKLKGVNFHQDFLNKGFAVGLDQKREDMLHIRRMGTNFLRVAHYPHHPYVLHLADSLGMIVWQEIPFINTVGREAFLDNTLAMLREMIERDKNHPSIVMWGLGNEFAMPWLSSEDVEWALRIITELHKLSKELDPDRLTVQGHNHLADKRIFEATDLQARNRYYGWYEDTYDDFAAALDEDKRNNPHWRVIISEYGAEGKLGHHVNAPRIFDHSETYQLNYHRAHWEAIRSRDFIAGSALWNMFDFGSTVKIGNIPRINQKGMMTKDRREKDVYYYYQSQWSDEPMVYIVSETWVHRSGPLENPRTSRSFRMARASSSSTMALHWVHKHLMASRWSGVSTTRRAEISFAQLRTLAEKRSGTRSSSSITAGK
jgi:beta-galactosidase